MGNIGGRQKRTPLPPWSLPKEIYLLILNNLSEEDLWALSFTCKYFKQFIATNYTLYPAPYLKENRNEQLSIQLLIVSASSKTIWGSGTRLSTLGSKFVYEKDWRAPHIPMTINLTALACPDIRTLKCKYGTAQITVQEVLRDERVFHGVDPEYAWSNAQAFIFWYDPYDKSTLEFVENNLQRLERVRQKPQQKTEDIYVSNRCSYGRYKYTDDSIKQEYIETLTTYTPDFKLTPKLLVEVLPDPIPTSSPVQVTTQMGQQLAANFQCKFVTVDFANQKSVDACFRRMCELFFRMYRPPKHEKIQSKIGTAKH